MAAAAAVSNEEWDQKKEAPVPADSPNLADGVGAAESPKEAGDVGPVEKNQQLASPPPGFPNQGRILAPLS